jgi:hypothetical protein
MNPLHFDIRNISGKGTGREKISLMIGNLPGQNLSGYVLCDAASGSPDDPDGWKHIFRFPSTSVGCGDHVKLYTRGGVYSKKYNSQGRPIHNFYWCLDHSVWDKANRTTLMLYLPLKAETEA